MKFCVFFSLFLFTAVSALYAAGEVSVQQVRIEDAPPFQYKVIGEVENTTAEPREVVLRAQAVIYDKSSPQGDVPIHVLRKDMTIVLRASEKRTVETVLFKEGRLPDVRLRIKPELRVRRQRLWMNTYEDPDPERR